MHPGDFFHADDAFVRSDVGKRRAVGDVADGINAGGAGAVEFIDNDFAALGFDAEVAKAEVFDVPYDAHSGEQHICLEHFLAFFGFDGGFHPVATGVNSGYLGARHDVDAHFLVDAGHLAGDLFIFAGEDIVEEFHDGDFGSHAVVEVGEFHSDGTGAHHDDGSWLAGQGHGFAVADDFFAVDGNMRQAAGAGAGGEDDVLGLVEGDLAVGAGDFDFAVNSHGAIAHDGVDFIFAEEEIHAFAHAFGHAAAAGHHLAEIVGSPFHMEAVFFGMVEVVHHFGAFEQGLGGDTAPVEAHPAERLALDHGSFHTELRSPDRGNIAAGSASNDDNIVGLRHVLT